MVKNSEEPRLRPMRLDDIKQIVEIEHEVFPTPWTEEAFYNEIVSNNFAHYVVLAQGEHVIGYGGLWTIIDEAHVTNIAVRKAYQGKQYGRKLLSALVAHAMALGMKEITLEVRVSNHIAQRLYESFNFRSVGVRKGYYTDNSEDALIMWASLQEEQS